MGKYISVPPRGSAKPTGREFFRNADSVPDRCRLCDNNYRLGLLREFRARTARNIGLYDLDLVLEADGRIVAVGEYKRFRQDYHEFLIPGFEYVALKKFAKLLRVRPLVIVERVYPDRASEYIVWTFDRFEGPGDRPMRSVNGKRWAAFDPSVGLRLDIDGLTGWITALIDAVLLFGGRF